MGSKYFGVTKQSYSKKGTLLYQKGFIERHYPFLKCKLENNVLICRGILESEDYRNSYEVEIKCVYGHEPSTRIVSPADITPSQEIHMYDDHTLCLHYPPDLKWSARTPIFQYTIPWLLEWPLYYELYLVNGGKWEGPQSPTHFTNNDKNLAEDISEE